MYIYTQKHYVIFMLWYNVIYINYFGLGEGR
jgi:hypothetical protein